MTTSVLVLGAGFGGLELASRLSHEIPDQVEVTLLDAAEGFVFGFSKLDVMFGRRTLEEVRVSYTDLSLPSVRFRQETITAIEPGERRVVTDLGTYDADVLVIALGAGYDLDATPGLAEAGLEFYSVEGAARVREVLPTVTEGDVVIGVCGPGFKCPPAPSECALLVDAFLRERGVREATSISLVMPFGTPVPPSPETSAALLERFTERDIAFVPDRRVVELDRSSAEAVLDDGSRRRFDLFLGIPVHRAPAVVVDAGLTHEGWIPVDPHTLATSFEGVYAVGDVTSVGTPKAGVFAERAARVVADQLIARIRGQAPPVGFDGTGTCYVELGHGEVGQVSVDFFSTPGHPTGTFTPPSPDLAQAKADFAPTRRARWFG
jgi:sulfide:quinone oxidoreductase